MIIKKIDMLSVGKISAFIYGFLGLIMGILFAFGSVLRSFTAQSMDPEVAEFAGKELTGGIFRGLGVLAIIVFPFLYAIMGFIGGCIGSLIYNFAAGKMGGIKLTVEQ